MSKLINQTRLQQFATKLWDKIKNRYDDAFVNAELTAAEKKIKFTKKKGGATVDVDLSDYVRLQDRNKFKKDVSVDDANFYNNASLGEITGTVNSAQRTLGARNLTSKMFTDGFVSTLRIHLDNSHAGNSFSVHLWEIKKGADKGADRTISKFKSGESFDVKEVDGQKYVDIPINKEYTYDTYFLFRSGDTARVKAIRNIPPSKANDVMNLIDRTPPPTGTDQALDLSNQDETETAYVEIFGRIGIVDLNKKIGKVSADSSLYVKHSETTATGGTASANKVVKLDDAGKLNKDMLPAIAINEFITIRSTSFNENSLNGKEYQNGDTIFNATTQKRYLCIDRDNATFLDRFIELNSKDGIVTSVEGKTGEVTLNIALEENKFKLKINGTGGTETVKEIEMISEDEITNMINALS